MGATDVVLVDCPAGSPWPLGRAAGMSLVERHVREARREGAEVVVRGGPAIGEHLGALGLVAAGVRVVPPDVAPPPGARVVAGDALCGVRVDGRAALRRAERALMRTCRRPFDGPGDRYVGRYLSLPITRLVARTDVAPSTITLISAAIGLVGIGFVAAGDRAALAIGGALYLVQLVLDSVDGELARVRHKASRRGMVIDNVSDDVLDTLYVVALGLAVGGVGVWVGLGAAALRAWVAVATYVAIARAGQPGDVGAFRWWYDRGDGPAGAGGGLSPAAVLRAFGRRDTYALFYGGLAALGLPAVALGLGAAIAVGYGALMAIHLAFRGR